MHYQGYYINLDKSVDRRRAMESQFVQMGLVGRYERFPAIDGSELGRNANDLTAGEIACFQSHAAVLQLALQRNAAAHILEDDAVLSAFCVPLLEHMCESGLMDTVDILFTETYVPLNLDYLTEYRKLFDRSVERSEANLVKSIKQVNLLELRDRVFAGMTSYLVSQKAIPRVVSMLAAELSVGPTMPVDLFIRKKIREGAIRAKCIFPFTTSVRIDSTLGTTIGERPADRLSVLATTFVRHSFFVGCDWTAADQIVQRVYGGAAKTAHDRLLETICAHVMFGDYRSS